MTIRLRKLWQVPAYCAAAGYISFHMIIFLTSNFAIVNLPDGSVTVNSILSAIFRTILFALTLFIGYLIFRKLTKSEIFWSASIMVAAQIIPLLIQYFAGGTALSVRIGLFLSYISEWNSIVTQLFDTITDNLWLGAFVSCFTPYLFIFFGTKHPK